MKYYKIFNHLDRQNAEEVFNSFIASVEEKGHRILYSKFYFDLNNIDAVYLITDQKRPEQPFERRRSPASVKIEEL